MFAVALALFTMPQTPGPEPEWTIKISGGHDTDRRDGGRPVALVAGALGVKPEVFREAFSHVKPAPGGQHPDPAQVQLNKKALMDALSPYGITNERLDQVSNYYRYRPQSGEMWPIKNAVVSAKLENGKLTGFTIANGGSGYSSTPTITVVGHPEIKAEVTLKFDKDFAKNGSIAEIKLKK